MTFFGSLFNLLEWFSRKKRGGDREASAQKSAHTRKNKHRKVLSTTTNMIGARLSVPIDSSIEKKNVVVRFYGLIETRSE